MSEKFSKPPQSAQKPQTDPPKARKLLDQVSEALRTKHYAYRTEQTYVDWIKRYILFHKKRHPKDMGANEIREFIAYLATERKVAASTQNPCTEPVEVRRLAPSSFYIALFWKKKSPCLPNL